MKLSVFFLIVVLKMSIAYKIFVYSPKWGCSHVTFMGKLADVLVQAGNNVTVYAPTIDASCTTNGTKLAKVVGRALDFDGLKLGGVEMQKAIWSGDLSSFSTMIKTFAEIRINIGKNCKNQLNDKTVLDELKSEKFDIALGEASFDLCYYGLMRVLGIKNYISVSSSTVFDEQVQSIPTTPNGIFHGNFPMSYSDRVANLINILLGKALWIKMMAGDSNEYLKEKFGEDFDCKEEAEKSALFFANVDEHVDFPRPISHKIIYIGGFSKVQAKPLEKKFDEIMQNSTRGVVLVSFGTVALSHAMPNKIKQIFLNTFKNFPDITFIWKYEKDEHKIADGIPNVVTDKWVPQNDLLEHPKLLAFVSHGGMNSAQEGASKGVPMVMIPLFADQYRNSKMLEYRKMAIVLERKNLTVEKLSTSIQAILEDHSYRTNAKRLAAMIEAKPMSAADRLVKYTEFAAKYGPNLNLNMEGSSLGVLQFYCLDIIFPSILLAVVIFYLIYRIIKIFFTFVFCRNKLKRE